MALHEPVANHDDQNMTPIHFSFIVHGHNGHPTDLSYLHHTIIAKANENMHAKSSDSCPVGRADKNAVTATQNESNRKLVGSNTLGAIRKETLIVHNAVCNEGKTHDGIIKGGERLANEMLEVIRYEVKQKAQHPKQNEELNQHPKAQQSHINVTVSMVGNSLGGLYGRYAVAQLAQVLENHTNISGEETNETRYHYLLDDFIRIHLNVFCSTAAPMLGCASHTWIPIPRTAEIGIARGLGDTGADLFRLNDLVETMATSHRFLKPFASFRKRIAYANAFGTDFPCPTATAGFLDENSDSPHYFDEYFGEEDGHEIAGESGRRTGQEKQCPATEKGLVAATLYTRRLPLEEENTQANLKDNVLTVMAKNLDSLGWKKVFIDVRKENPSVSLPTMFKSDCPIRQLKSDNTMVKSSDLARVISTSNTYQLSIPLGHNILCALSGGLMRRVLNSGGRPVMDSLAIDLTNTISLWHEFKW